MAGGSGQERGAAIDTATECVVTVAEAAAAVSAVPVAVAVAAGLAAEGWRTGALDSGVAEDGLGRG